MFSVFINCDSQVMKEVRKPRYQEKTVKNKP